MPVTKLAEQHIKALQDQIRVSVVQGILQVLGANNTVRITEGTVGVERLTPVGSQVTIRLTLDIYPKDEVAPIE